MARYKLGRKEETHLRLVHLASERFRKDGIDGVGVASLMADAGLTHGGFYAHFDSKEALVREAVVHALATMPIEEASKGDAPDELDLPLFIDRYLSPFHRDKPGKGCAVAALGPELARRPRASRTAFKTEGSHTIERIAASLPGALTPDERLSRAYTVFSHLLGTLQLARFIPEKATSDAILVGGRSAARTLAGLPE